MIVSRLPPDPPDGDVACAIHTPTFNCFVSTSPDNGRWETMIFEGDPGVDDNWSPCLRFVHPADCDAQDAALLNEAIAFGLDLYGDAGVTLEEAGKKVFWTLVRKGVALQIFWPSTQ